MRHTIQDVLRRAEQGQHDLSDTKLFHDVFASACEVLRLEDVDISNALPVDRTTVNRWRNGGSAPRPLMRKPLYRVVVQRLRKRIRETEPDGSPNNLGVRPGPARKVLRRALAADKG